MKKIITILVVLLVISGCAGKSNKKTLEIFSTKSENIEILEKMIKEFEEQEDLKVTFTAPADAGTVLKTRLTKNDLPDVIIMGGDATFVELANAKVLKDFSNETVADRSQNAYKEMIKSIYKEDGLFGVPFASNASGIIYNVDVFNAANVEIPTTWDEFLDVINKLEEAGFAPFELTFKDAWTMMPIWNSLVPSLQPDNFPTARRSNETTFTEVPAFNEVLEKLSVIMDHAQNDYMGTTYSDGNVKFGEGKSGMMINGNWAIPEIKNTAPDINLDIFPFPASNDASKNYVVSGVDVLFTISEGSNFEEEALKFISFMTEKENAELYVKDQSAFSALNGVVQDDPSVAGAQKAIGEGQVANFPDHYYPSGFDLAALLSEFGLNKVNGTDVDTNIKTILQKIDEAYDTANVE